MMSFDTTALCHLGKKFKQNSLGVDSFFQPTSRRNPIFILMPLMLDLCSPELGRLSPGAKLLAKIIQMIHCGSASSQKGHLCENA
jgi:hypothetical protein